MSVSTASTLREGSRGDAVKALQQKLISLGYLSGSADGVFGAGTKSAVIAFQRANGLTADGAVGAKTLSAIESAAASSPAAGQAQTNDADAILKKGSSGDAVKALQQNLIQLGYLTGEADGQFGSATKRAVRAFQAANGLSADGSAGEKTLSAIQSAVSAVSTATILKEGSQVQRGGESRLSILSRSADGQGGSKDKGHRKHLFHVRLSFLSKISWRCKFNAFQRTGQAEFHCLWQALSERAF